MSDRIDISGLDKAEVLAALFNASKPQGMGFSQPFQQPMTKGEAAKLLEGQKYFDYIRGRVMKVNLSGDLLSPLLYDRDLGQGAAARVVAVLREQTGAKR